MSKSIYFFPGDAKATLEEVGGKGLSLLESSRALLPVPPGCILTVYFFEPWLSQLKTTDAWKMFLEVSNDALAHACAVLKQTAAALYEEYLKAHADLRRDEWIIDGFGCVTSAWERFSKADTLVYILPLITHCWWVTKRLIKSLFVTLEGWPENSPMWSSTVFDKRLSKESDRTGGTDAHAYERQEPGQQRQRQVRQRRPGAEVQAERAPPRRPDAEPVRRLPRGPHERHDGQPRMGPPSPGLLPLASRHAPRL